MEVFLSYDVEVEVVEVLLNDYGCIQRLSYEPSLPIRLSDSKYAQTSLKIHIFPIVDEVGDGL